MKLFKKLMVALSVLLVIGMLAACSDGSKSKSATREGWDIYYNGQSILGEPEEDEKPMTWEDVQMGITMYGLTEGTDYSVNQSSQILTLTKSGYDKMEAMENAVDDLMNGEDSSDTYSVTYSAGEPPEEMTENEFKAYTLMFGLTAGTDYTKDTSAKTITLTASGAAKIEAFYGSLGADEDDED